jgi:excisionase family DNA binding protein
MKLEQASYDTMLPLKAPLTTAELGRRIGMSQTFIREEIHTGHLRAIVVGRGRKRVFRILATEAQRYMKQLGVL